MFIIGPDASGQGNNAYDRLKNKQGKIKLCKTKNKTIELAVCYSCSSRWQIS